MSAEFTTSFVEQRSTGVYRKWPMTQKCLSCLLPSRSLTKIYSEQHVNTWHVTSSLLSGFLSPPCVYRFTCAGNLLLNVTTTPLKLVKVNSWIATEDGARVQRRFLITNIDMKKKKNNIFPDIHSLKWINSLRCLIKEGYQKVSYVGQEMKKLAWKKLQVWT